MRHFKFIKAIYKTANINVDDKKILAVYNLAKRVAENSTLAQFTFAGIEWSVRDFEDSMRVSLITEEIIYSIYDGDEYMEPTIEIDILKK